MAINKTVGSAVVQGCSMMRDERKPQPLVFTVIGWGIAILLCLLALFGSVLMEKETPDRSAVSALVAANPEMFSSVIPGIPLTFPRDYGVHNDFRQEWWYITGNVQDRDGNQYGIQWTLFRSALHGEKGEGWSDNHIYMAHAVLTSKNGVYAAERFARGGIGQAGVTPNPFNAWLDNWQWTGSGAQPFPGTLQAADKGFSFNLHMHSTRPELLQGDNGYSQKHADKPVASYYFSVPAIALNGTITINGNTVEVAGKGWVDREWSTQALSEDQIGWDWFSIQLNEGRSLMLVQVRGERTPYRFGVISDESGWSETLTHQDINMMPVDFAKMPTGRHLPVKWKLSVPKYGIDLTTEPLHQQNWLPFTFPYWEGPIIITGSGEGIGFMEATGY
ncbi:lipocalin-like domain-containing protein [Grimontia hollisae]|uniref:lipocalin-like domain-containing protein n=1 Tax=Grimontia hollisae TaxID=673 RepID=UPI001E3E430B|nr:lipocalin-like domain-containing protein [Grimontia hollisae]